MTLSRSSRIALLLASLAWMPAFAQRAPDSVTDAEIGQLQSSIEQGCLRRGAEKHDPEKAVHDSCTCATGVLRDKLSKQEWQAAVAAAFNGDKDTAMTILSKHKDEVMTCKPQ